jgi:hypothetical protein
MLLILDTCEHIVDAIADLVHDLVSPAARGCGCWPPAGRRCACEVRRYGGCRPCRCRAPRYRARCLQILHRTSCGCQRLVRPPAAC